MQVSRSKKWASKPLLDDAGKPVLQKNGKPVLKKSYSILQDDFFNYMHNVGSVSYTHLHIFSTRKGSSVRSAGLSLVVRISWRRKKPSEWSYSEVSAPLPKQRNRA